MWANEANVAAAAGAYPTVSTSAAATLPHHATRPSAACSSQPPNVGGERPVMPFARASLGTGGGTGFRDGFTSTAHRDLGPSEKDGDGAAFHTPMHAILRRHTSRLMHSTPHTSTTPRVQVLSKGPATGSAASTAVAMLRTSSTFPQAPSTVAQAETETCDSASPGRALPSPTLSSSSSSLALSRPGSQAISPTGVTTARFTLQPPPPFPCTELHGSSRGSDVGPAPAAAGVNADTTSLTASDVSQEPSAILGGTTEDRDLDELPLDLLDSVAMACSSAEPTPSRTVPQSTPMRDHTKEAAALPPRYVDPCAHRGAALSSPLAYPVAPTTGSGGSPLEDELRQQQRLLMHARQENERLRQQIKAHSLREGFLTQRLQDLARSGSAGRPGLLGRAVGGQGGEPESTEQERRLLREKEELTTALVAKSRAVAQLEVELSDLRGKLTAYEEALLRGHGKTEHEKGRQHQKEEEDAYTHDLLCQCLSLSDYIIKVVNALAHCLHVEHVPPPRHRPHMKRTEHASDKGSAASDETSDDEEGDSEPSPSLLAAMREAGTPICPRSLAACSLRCLQASAEGNTESAVDMYARGHGERTTDLARALREELAYCEMAFVRLASDRVARMPEAEAAAAENARRDQRAKTAGRGPTAASPSPSPSPSPSASRMAAQRAPADVARTGLSPQPAPTERNENVQTRIRVTGVPGSAEASKKGTEYEKGPLPTNPHVNGYASYGRDRSPGSHEGSDSVSSGSSVASETAAAAWQDAALSPPVSYRLHDDRHHDDSNNTRSKGMKKASPSSPHVTQTSPMGGKYALQHAQARRHSPSPSPWNTWADDEASNRPGTLTSSSQSTDSEESPTARPRQGAHTTMREPAVPAAEPSHKGTTAPRRTGRRTDVQDCEVQ